MHDKVSIIFNILNNNKYKYIINFILFWVWFKEQKDDLNDYSKRNNRIQKQFMVTCFYTYYNRLWIPSVEKQWKCEIPLNNILCFLCFLVNIWLFLFIYYIDWLLFHMINK